MGKLGYIVRCIAHMDYSALFDTVKQVHKLSGKPRAVILADIVSCGFKYGAGYKDYLLCEFYNLNSEQRATFVTRGINNTVVKLLNDPDYYHILDNKTEFYTMFNDYLHRKWLNFAKCSKSEFVDFMQEFDEIICKPDDLCCGKGVDKLKKADFGSLDDMYDELKRRHISIVEEVVKQHHDMSRINPDSVNTIRVYTVLTDGKANTIYACIRMGNSDRPVDNINAGGMYSPIDMKTGKIAFPACDKQRKVYEKHPRSGCELKGYQIPFWEESIAMCCEAAEKLPQLGYIGWDVAITDNGPLFIEANNMPGHDALPQMPLQAPDKIGFLPTLRQYVKGI